MLFSRGQLLAHHVGIAGMAAKPLAQPVRLAVERLGSRRRLERHHATGLEIRLHRVMAAAEVPRDPLATPPARLQPQHLGHVLGRLHRQPSLIRYRTRGCADLSTPLRSSIARPLIHRGGQFLVSPRGQFSMSPDTPITWNRRRPLAVRVSIASERLRKKSTKSPGCKDFASSATGQDEEDWATSAARSVDPEERTLEAVPSCGAISHVVIFAGSLNISPLGRPSPAAGNARSFLMLLRAAFYKMLSR